MNCPECDDLKKTYDDCFQEFIVNRAKNWDYKQMSEDSINKCDDVFQDYKGCVELSMKRKIEARKKKS